jgi:hypothetical protein
MGEAKKRGLMIRQQVVEALGLQTASGQIKVRWDENGQATAQGQMAFHRISEHHRSFRSVGGRLSA